MFSLQERLGDIVGRVMASDTGQRLIVWQAGLPERDRRALTVMSLFLGVVLLFALVIYPPYRFSSDARERLNEQQELLAWMRANEERARTLTPAASGALEQPLQALVSSSAQTQGLSLRRMEPLGEDGLRIWLDGVAFNELLPWLDALSAKQVRVAEVSMERDDAPGRVNVRLGLRG